MDTPTSTARGFTLIELMITVAVVGILAAVAYPSYQSYMSKSRRLDAKISLMSAAQAMERFYTENMSYASATAGTVFPTSSNEGHYTIGFADGSPAAEAFTLTATPVASGPQNGDKCGTFTLNNLGAQDVADATLSAAECWKK